MSKMTLTVAAVGLLACRIAQADLEPPLAEVGSIQEYLHYDLSTRVLSLAAGVSFGLPEDAPPVGGEFSLLANVTPDDAISGGVVTIFGTIPSLGSAPTLLFAAHVTGAGFGVGPNYDYESFGLAVDYSNPIIGSWGPSAILSDNPIGYTTIAGGYAGTSIDATTLGQLFSQSWYSSPPDYYVLYGSLPVPEPATLSLLGLGLAGLGFLRRRGRD